MQHVTSNNDGTCWQTMMRPFAMGFIHDRGNWFTAVWIQSRFDASRFD